MINFSSRAKSWLTLVLSVACGHLMSCRESMKAKACSSGDSRVEVHISPWESGVVIVELARKPGVATGVKVSPGWSIERAFSRDGDGSEWAAVGPTGFVTLLPSHRGPDFVSARLRWKIQYPEEFDPQFVEVEVDRLKIKPGCL